LIVCFSTEDPSEVFDLEPQRAHVQPLGEARVRFLGSLGSFPDFCTFFPQKSGSVAVGTLVTQRPPHGSVLEELPHTALTSDA